MNKFISDDVFMGSTSLSNDSYKQKMECSTPLFGISESIPFVTEDDIDLIDYINDPNQTPSEFNEKLKSIEAFDSNEFNNDSDAQPEIGTPQSPAHTYTTLQYFENFCSSLKSPATESIFVDNDDESPEMAPEVQSKVQYNLSQVAIPSDTMDNLNSLSRTPVIQAGYKMRKPRRGRPRKPIETDPVERNSVSNSKDLRRINNNEASRRYRFKRSGRVSILDSKLRKEKFRKQKLTKMSLNLENENSLFKFWLTSKEPNKEQISFKGLGQGGS